MFLCKIFLQIPLHKYSITDTTEKKHGSQCKLPVIASQFSTSEVFVIYNTVV